MLYMVREMVQNFRQKNGAGLTAPF